MRIGGLQKFTLIDYPGKMAAIIFTQGCNFRCGYCYNPQLVRPEQFTPPIHESVVLDFLRSRQGQLEGVVVTGGEPTIQQGLAAFLTQVKAMGYAVKLDTNGSNPEILSALIQSKLIDFIAMDIKTSLGFYEQAVGVKFDAGRIKASIRVILESGLAHQFRTTLVKPQACDENLKEIQLMLGASRKYVLQSFVPMAHIIDRRILDQEQYALSEVQRLRAMYQRGS